jgi:VPDSG-CTERM motif
VILRILSPARLPVPPRGRPEAKLQKGTRASSGSRCLDGGSNSARLAATRRHQKVAHTSNVVVSGYLIVPVLRTRALFHWKWRKLTVAQHYQYLPHNSKKDRELGIPTVGGAHIFVTSSPADAANGVIATGFAGEAHGNFHLPDGGSTAMLLIVAFAGLGLLRRHCDNRTRKFGR